LSPAAATNDEPTSFLSNTFTFNNFISTELDDDDDDELDDGFVQIATCTGLETVIRDRLRERFDWWRDTANASDDVLNAIKSGYKFPLRERPPPFHARKNWSGATSDHGLKWIDDALKELERGGVVRQVEAPPYCICPLNVVPKSSRGKFRLIHDLRHVNEFMEKQPFHMETLERCRTSIRRGDWMASVDLTQGYAHVNIHPDHVNLMGFSHRSRYFVQQQMPFGARSAPYFFTALTGTLARRWRALGIRVQFYLDDFLFLNESKAGLQKDMARALEDLHNSGFLVNMSKCHLEPTQDIEFLGITINTLAYTFAIPDRRVSKFEDAKEQMRQAQGRPSARLVARLTGLLMSMAIVLGNTVRLHTRYLYDSIYEATRGNIPWDSTVTLGKLAKRELHFWSSFDLEAARSSVIIRPFAMIEKRQVDLSGDASDFAWGGIIHRSNERPIIARGEFSKEEQSRGSAWRELKGYLETLRAFAGRLRGTKVVFRVDAASAVQIYENRGSQLRDIIHEGHLHLHDLIVSICEICALHDIDVHFKWIPRELNVSADDVSKTVDDSAFGLDPCAFAAIEREWGGHAVDIFASAEQHFTPTFFSRWHSPGSSGVDALSHVWPPGRVWVHPPITLIPAAIQAMRDRKAFGTFVVPHWITARWWLDLSSGPHLRGSWVLGQASRLLRKPDGTTPRFKRRGVDRPTLPHFNMIAFRVDFR
jgi:hypothetical protein